MTVVPEGRILLLYKRGGWVKSQHLVPSYQAFWEKTKNKKRGGGEQESLYGLLHRIAQKKVRAKFKIKKDSLNWEVVKAWDKTTWNCSFHPFRAQDQRLKRSTGQSHLKFAPCWPDPLLLVFPLRSKQGEEEELTLGSVSGRTRYSCSTTLGFPVFAWVDRHFLNKKWGMCFSLEEPSGTSRKGFELISGSRLVVYMSRGLGHMSKPASVSPLLFLLFSKERSERYTETGQFWRIPAPCCIINLILKLVPASWAIILAEAIKKYVCERVCSCWWACVCPACLSGLWDVA